MTVSEEPKRGPGSKPQSRARPRARGRAVVIGRDDLLGVIQGFNPWWRGRAPQAPEFHRTPYIVCRKYLDDESLRRAVLLSGPRRVGKTTILQQVAKAMIDEGRPARSVCYVSLDHPALVQVPLSQVIELYHEAIFPEGEPAVLLLDEVQYSERWDLHLKQLVDHRPEYRILATGSASLEHRRRLTESGVGRWVTVPIPTLSFYEFLRLRGADLSAVPADLRTDALFSLEAAELSLLGSRFRPLMPLFGRYLILGGFPEPAVRDDVEFGQRVLREDVIDGVLKRDITALYKFRNVADLEKLFVYLCVHSGGIFSVTNCANALGATKPTVSNYLQGLREANLVYLLPPFKRTGKQALKAPPKVYLVDAALRNAVLLKGEEVLADATQMGTIVETTVLRHLLSRYHWDAPEITYWRGARRGREIDFVVKTPRYTVAVEVKYRSDAQVSSDAGLVDFCAENDVERAFWVTQREQDFGRSRLAECETEVLRVPAHILVYLLGQDERLQWGEG